MDNPENIIYVILIIGSLIWSGVKKFIAKPAKTEQQTAQPTKPKRSLEDIFRELAGDVQPQSQPAVVQPIKVKQQPQIVPRQQIMNDALALEKHAVKRSEQQEILYQHSFTVDFNDAADWQKAFVYSEIFNRKY